MNYHRPISPSMLGCKPYEFGELLVRLVDAKHGIFLHEAKILQSLPSEQLQKLQLKDFMEIIREQKNG